MSPSSTRLLTLALMMVCVAGCEGDGHLRGTVSPSSDGQTYLSIVDDNGGGCGDFIVDGDVWHHSIGAAAAIDPGVHAIDCGALEDFDPENAIMFDIPAGVVFRFNYWGP